MSHNSYTFDLNGKLRARNKMAKINRNDIQGSEQFKSLVSKSSEHGEFNDCTVKATALVGNVSYEQAHALLKSLGRKNRHGCHMIGMLESIGKDLSIEFVKVDPKTIIAKYPKGHCDVLKSVTTHHPARFNGVWKDGKSYLAFTRGHVAAIIDGKTHDWTEGRAKRVVRLYEVVKK